MAGYHQSVSGYGTSQASPYFQPVQSREQSFDPELPPGLETQLRPGETGAEYYKRMGIPLPPGFEEGIASDAPQGRRRRREQRIATDEIPEPPQPASSEDDWLMGPPEAILRQAPPVDPRTIGAIEGAPWFERLKASVLFDSESTENWLRDHYSDENVFRDSDDALYFLPPNEAKKPVEAQVWVRFNPEGLDTGDLVAFVPGVTAGLLASVAVGLSGGSGILGTMAAAGLGGVGSEAVTQTAGALMSDESHVTPMDRAERLALAGTVEAATAGLGGIATEGVKRGTQAVRSGLGRLGRSVAESGADPAEMAARRSLMDRRNMPFSVGQETGGTIPLAIENTLRQNVLTADIARPVDAALQERFYQQARDLVQGLSKSGGTQGAQAAINAHKLRLQHLASVRAKAWDELFDQAIVVAGDSRIAETKNLRKALRELKKAEASHASAGDAQAIIRMAENRLEDIGEGGATIRELQNAMAEHRRIAKDGRGLSEKIKNPSNQKRVANTILDALYADLQATIEKTPEKVRRELSRLVRSGKMTAEEMEEQVAMAASGAEASSLLSQARSTYRTLSEEIADITANPLAAYEKNPEDLLKEIFKFTDDADSITSVMKFLDEVSPEAANKFRARAAEEMFYKAANTTADDAISPDKFATAATRSRKQLDALMKGNPKAKSAFDDMVKSAKVLKDRGARYGSQTFQGEFVNWLTKYVGGGALVGSSILSGGYPSQLIEEALALAGTVFTARTMARALFRPEQASLYRKLFNMMKISNPGPGTRKAAVQTLLDLSRGYAGYTQLEDEENRQSLKDVPPGVRRALMLAPGEL